MAWGRTIPELEEAREAVGRQDVVRVMKLVASRPIILDDEAIRRMWRERVEAYQNVIASYEETYRPYERGEQPSPFSRDQIRAARTDARHARAELRKLLLRDSRASASIETERHVCELVRATHRALSEFFGRLKRDPRWRDSWRRWAELSVAKRRAVFEEHIERLEEWCRGVRESLADATLASDVRGALVDLVGAVPLPPTRRVGRDPIYGLLAEPKWGQRNAKPSELAWQALAWLLGTSESTLRRRIRRTGVAPSPRRDAGSPDVSDVGPHQPRLAHCLNPLHATPNSEDRG